jgi:hypothetical protein
MAHAEFNAGGDPSLYEDLQGVSLLSEIDDINEALARQTAKSDGQEERITALEEELHASRSGERANSTDREAYRDIRHQFLDGFLSHGRAGNAAGGDCVANADLYRSERQNQETFNFVYKVTPDTVQKLGKTSSYLLHYFHRAFFC